MQCYSTSYKLLCSFDILNIILKMYHTISFNNTWILQRVPLQPRVVCNSILHVMYSISLWMKRTYLNTFHPMTNWTTKASPDLSHLLLPHPKNRAEIIFFIKLLWVLKWHISKFLEQFPGLMLNEWMNEWKKNGNNKSNSRHPLGAEMHQTVLSLHVHYFI